MLLLTVKTHLITFIYCFFLYHNLALQLPFISLKKHFYIHIQQSAVYSVKVIYSIDLQLLRKILFAHQSM